jgi:hypothetical protein
MIHVQNGTGNYHPGIREQQFPDTGVDGDSARPNSTKAFPPASWGCSLSTM